MPKQHCTVLPLIRVALRNTALPSLSDFTFSWWGVKSHLFVVRQHQPSDTILSCLRGFKCCTALLRPLTRGEFSPKKSSSPCAHPQKTSQQWAQKQNLNLRCKPVWIQTENDLCFVLNEHSFSYLLCYFMIPYRQKGFISLSRLGNMHASSH